MTQPNALSPNASLFTLEYPQSLGVYDSYSDAQKAVDQLADSHFPVNNLAIVGTDLRLMERVTGRRTWGTVLTQGVTSGLSTGFIVAIVMMILQPQPDSFFVMLLTALLIGVVIGLAFAVLGYALSRGRRDFTSVSQTIATKYELLCEHKVAAQARELLAKGAATRGNQFNQPGPQQFPPYPGSQPSYGQGYPPPGYGQQGWSPSGYDQPGAYPQPGYGPGPYPQQPYGQAPSSDPSGTPAAADAPTPWPQPEPGADPHHAQPAQEGPRRAQGEPPSPDQDFRRPGSE